MSHILTGWLEILSGLPGNATKSNNLIFIYFSSIIISYRKLTARYQLLTEMQLLIFLWETSEGEEWNRQTDRQTSLWGTRRSGCDACYLAASNNSLTKYKWLDTHLCRWCDVVGLAVRWAEDASHATSGGKLAHFGKQYREKVRRDGATQERRPWNMQTSAGGVTSENLGKFKTTALNTAGEGSITRWATSQHWPVVMPLPTAC